MSLAMTDIEIHLPERDRRASWSGGRVRKPMATVLCTVEGGRQREIVLPVRVARVLTAEGIGLPLEEDLAFDAIHALEGRVCFTMLTEMLSRRDHASQEAYEKLSSYGFRDQEIEQALERARSLRFLDDDRFLNTFIEERKRRGWGMRKVSAELRKRGIDPNQIEGFPDAFFDDDDDAERALQLLRRKRIPDTRPFEKLCRHLVSKGFSYSIAADAVRSFMEEGVGADVTT